MNEKTLSEFGDYLLSHRDEIAAEWVVAVQRGLAPDLPGYFGDSQLVDHLPELFQKLSAVLKARNVTTTAAKFLVLRGGMAGIAGAKVTSSIKSYVRPA
jgi:RsbT co-antagonist protein rsbRD N-terminal domain